MNLSENFGELLAVTIYDNNLNPASFSTAIGIDCSVIYKYIRKEVLPNLTNLILIADYLKCSTDYLLGRTQTNPKTIFKPAQPFSAQLKKFLKEKSKNRNQLRKAKRFARQSVDDWYHGKRIPNVENAVLIAEFFDCTLDCLLGRE